MKHASNNLSQINPNSSEFNAGKQPFMTRMQAQDDCPKGEDRIVPMFSIPGYDKLDPRLLTIDCLELTSNFKKEAFDEQSGKIASDRPFVQNLKSKMEALFNRYGAVYLTNTNLSNFEDMSAISGLLFGDSMRYSGGSNFRGKLAGNVYDIGAPKEAYLHYHHEMAYVKESTEHLSFLCYKGLKGERALAGATYISDNHAATKYILSTDFGQRLKEKGLCYVRKLPDLDFFQKNKRDSAIVYNYWQTSFETSCPEEAEKRAKQKGLEVTWENSESFGRYMVTKYYVSAFEYCPFSQKNLLYASVADDAMWFDDWPGLRGMNPEDRPLELTYGDGTQFTYEEKKLFVEVYDRYGFPIPWQTGDMAFICNYRMAHGRPGIKLLPGENRELGVILGKTFTRQGSRNGCW